MDEAMCEHKKTPLRGRPKSGLIQALHRSMRLHWERRSTHRRCGDDGNAMVEFALVLPILMMVVTGIFTFGIALNNYIQLTNAVGIAARQISMDAGNTTDPCATVATAVYGAAPYLNQSHLALTLTVNGSVNSGTSCPSTATTGAAANLVSGNSVTLNVQYPCSIAIMGINYAPGCTLQAQTSELVQ